MIPVEVNITHRRRWRSPKTITRNFEIPENWSEVDDEMKPVIVRHLIKENYFGARLKVLGHYLEMDSQMMALSPVLDITEAFKFLEWMNMAPTTTPLLPFFNHNGLKYYCTGESFKDGLNLEFAKADEFYEAYVDGDDSALLKLTALLYRRKRKKDLSDPHSLYVRYPLHPDGMEILNEFVEELSDLPREYQMMSLWYWAGVKKYVHDIYGSFLFHKPSGDDENESDQTDSTKGVLFGWWGKFLEIADNGPFGNYNDVLMTNFHTTCMYLVKRVKEYRELEKTKMFNKARRK